MSKTFEIIAIIVIGLFLGFMLAEGIARQVDVDKIKMEKFWSEMLEDDPELYFRIRSDIEAGFYDEI